MDLTLPRCHFPEWWNINSHRCNHLGRLPTYQDSYGFGRSFVGDWGRVGGVNIVHDDKIRVDTQISTAIANKLHSPNIPEPLLHPHYRGVPDFDQFQENQYSSQDQTENETIDYVTVRHYGYKHLLGDPIMGSQASAAFLCGKIQGLLRRNVPATIKENGSFHQFLSQLISEAESGLNCSSTNEQDHILNNIRFLLEPSKATRHFSNEDNCVSQSSEETTGPPSKRRKSIPILNCPLKPTLKKLLHPPRPDGIPDVNAYTRYLTSFDPLLIRFCAFPTNPNYLGNGLVCKIRPTFLEDSTEHSSVLVWCPPKSESIYYSDLSDFDQVPLKFCSVQLPSKIRTPLTELLANFSTSGHIDMVTRSLPHTDGSQNASFLRLTSKHPDRLELSISDVYSPLLPGNATSVCLSPWLSGEWSSAGNFVNPNGDHVGFVQLFDIERPDQTVWSGQIILDKYLDELRSQHEAHLKSFNSINQSDAVQLDLDTYLSEISSRLNQLDYKPHYSWLHVNFGSCPGELSICSPKRILLMDTRQPGQDSMARELLSLESNQLDIKRFNLFDRLNCMPNRWIGDVYLVAGMTYSMVVLDKRMPGRCVLHWSHNLLGTPTYSDWTKLSVESVRKSDSMPNYLVPMASQYPAEVSVFGLDFNSASSVQLVGPSLIGAPLTNLLHRPKTKLPSCLYQHESINNRLQSSLCGLTTVCVPNTNDLDHDEPVLRTVILTSLGDLFSHSWYLKQEQADRRSNKINLTISDWLTNLSCTSTTKDLNLLAQPANSIIVEGQLRLDEIGQFPDLGPVIEPDNEPEQPMFWSMDEISHTSDFNETSEYVHCSKHLVRDLKTIWDVAGSGQVANFVKYLPSQLLSLDSSRISEEEERKHKTDCPNAASEERLDRLRSVVRNILCDSSVEDSPTENEDENDDKDKDYDDENNSNNDCDENDELNPSIDLDSSLFAMTDNSSINLSSPD